ncbi:MAG TPA: restriction endonuclease subunit S [Polyangiaceae bacterium]|nr:restriction endonuclease subunit S [Polyangiaceae bacterium]
MGAEWRLASLGASGVTLIDCDHRTPPAASTGYPYVAIPQLKAGRIDLSGVRRISAEHFVEWTRKASPQPFDVVLSRRCNPGETAFVASDLKFALGQNLVLLRSNGTKILPEFLRWLVRGPQWWEQVQKFLNVGAVFDSLRCADVPKFELPVPPLPAQRAIARILGGLDDKIELNRKMNATLEAMARALFKSWFVEAPEADWQTAPLAEWVDVLSGGTPSKANAALWGGTLKWISPKAMTSIHADECDDHVSEQAVGSGTRIAPKGATLVMVRGMGLHDGVRVSQAREDVTFNQDVKALVPRTIEADLLLFAMLDAQEELHKRVETSGHGTGKMPSEILLAHPITMPSREVQRKRAVHISAMNDRIAANRSESRNLARMRDDLLPRLLSGELPVDAAERAVEEVA